MAEVNDLTIRIRAVDGATPVLKRVRRRLWWMQYGDAVVVLLAAAIAVGSYILGRLT
jgi:hypothetical protein